MIFQSTFCQLELQLLNIQTYGMWASIDTLMLAHKYQNRLASVFVSAATSDRQGLVGRVLSPDHLPAPPCGLALHPSCGKHSGKSGHPLAAAWLQWWASSSHCHETAGLIVNLSGWAFSWARREAPTWHRKKEKKKSPHQQGKADSFQGSKSSAFR